jgi:hypothetical protein
MEPEIQRCMLDARRCLQEGKVREALPHLKQVLALDRTHPVALRLMNGIRDRVRRRATGPADAGSDPGLPSLPASGGPGSDASPSGPPLSTEPPAPQGRGLPSSPPADTDQGDISEIDLEVQPLEPEAAPSHQVSATDATADDEVVMGQPMEIQLEPETDAADTGHRSARTGIEPESPFAGEEEEGEEEPEIESVPLDDRALPPTPEPEKRPADVLDATAGIGTEPVEDPATARPKLPPAPGTAKKGGKVPVAALAAILLLTAGGVAAWWFGLIPGLAAPAPRPLEVARPSSSAAAQEAGDPSGGDLNPALAGADGEASPAPPTAGTEAAAPPREEADRPAPQQRRDPQAALVLFEEGQDLFASGEYARAAETFKKALSLDPVNPDIAGWQAKAEDQVRERRRVEAQRSTAVEAFESKDFETALRKFYRLQQEEPDGPYARYIANSWYNWGLQFLAAGNLREADRKMDEVLAVRPDDQEAMSIKELVAEYQNRAKDRLFYIRIEALRYRPLDA